ncbi:putative sensor domain DACNV-containing protein [Urbifossiella limnaea]|uniref:DAC domain-containing protein n=1 Tax=Urbifossiella limnaea TaxID=2528023 RepID=A0A517XQQ5_9BACT|nr:diadenylate cyclase [Urbifossiella limnaea]QDU19838.1 hypothetical protein ETAA1_17760 [Urbifossiella limnaea]
MAKQPKRSATDRVYPRDLAATLLRTWNPEPFFEGWPRVELPPKAVLGQFLDVCYHASMLTEEGRPTVFRIVLQDSKSPVSPRHGEELPPVTRYTFTKPIPFTETELRRLAPVADPRKVLIAVESTGEGDQAQLQIYGLVDIGMALWEMARHERVMGHSSPEALVVVSTRPGELSISRGDRPVVRLRDGRIVSPTDSVLHEGPIAEFFSPASTVFINNACQLAEIDQDPDEDDGLRMAHQTFIESLLLYTADLHHGGTLLFVPEEMAHDDPRLLSRVSIKYVLPSTRPRDALVSAMAARLQHNAVMTSLEDRKTVKIEVLQALEALAEREQECDDAAKDAARFIASLTAVDGAVVLTDTLRIIGFGAEVIAAPAATDTVHIAQTAQGDESRPIEFTEFGTRHRSAYRFTAGLDNSVAFVLSEDGGIKAVRQVGPRLLLWPYFNIGFVTALT